jgi:hypothetical protein
METLEPIDGFHSFYHLAVPFQPWISIRERADPDNLNTTRSIGKSGGADHLIHDRMIRRYGDIPGVAMKGKGITGSLVTLPVQGQERILNLSWLVHCVLKFDTAHDEAASGTHDAFIFGRAATGASPAFGWGALWWQGSTGKLRWIFQEKGGSPVVMETGIVVNPATPANQIVNFTVWRDAIGDYRFYDGVTLKATITGNRNNAHKEQATDWRWFDSSQTGGFLHAWDGIIEQFWVLDTISLQAKLPGGVGSAGGFIARTNGKNLRRDEGLGLMRHVKFNEAHYIGGTPFLSTPSKNAAWTRDGPNNIPKSAIYAITDASPALGAAMDAATISAEVARGWRLGDDSTSVLGSGSVKKWGGPLLLAVEKVVYEVRPHDGMVLTKFELGNLKDQFTQSIESIQREITRTADLITKSTEANLE